MYSDLKVKVGKKLFGQALKYGGGVGYLTQT